MPAVDLSKNESDLANRLNLLTIDIFSAWLIRDLEKTPLPGKGILRQRLIEHRRLGDSLFGHADVIALEGILTPEHAEICLESAWKERGMKALLDPALAARLRLSRSQRDEVAFLLTNKDEISDMQSEAQGRPVLPVSDPESVIVSERIARDARDRLDQVDGLIWETLTSAQARVLSRIMGEMQQAPLPAAKRKKATRPA